MNDVSGKFIGVQFDKIDILRHIYRMYFSSIILSDLVEYAERKGADVVEFKRDAKVFQENQYISYQTMVQYLNQIGQMLNDENLGLHIGEQISLKATTQVDNIMQYSETLKDSFENAVEYSKLISDALHCTLQKTGDYYSVIFEENPNWKVQQSYAKKQILDLTLYSCLKSLVTYTNRNYRPIKIHFENSKPKSLNEYYRLFNCRLHFNQSKTQIFFERQIFNKHKKNEIPGLLEDLKEKVKDEMKSLKGEHKVIFELKKCILRHKPERIPIEKASQNLNVSKRTLQRKLKLLDTSFKEVEYELQLRLAKTYLEEKQSSIDEISYLLGFSESSAFIRFFKLMTGETPVRYAKSLPYKM
ncbi:AraC family transcriptional regulator [Flagellimonas allohymeniacidonis]|uniref:AraC family transcriptional regulator n=1 Tax=Flagellimonas allohymeniacidonis TaxID=2517819 RepID=A0A4Q8QBT4_9FLAO|nr:AraC family transcriptional regulator [Allomuricauda hymeniacidonis]TAI47815.1 AraC family transcriptional regulator [Allomuricauda hymeniacidonis]